MPSGHGLAGGTRETLLERGQVNAIQIPFFSSLQLAADTILQVGYGVNKLCTQRR